MKRLRSFLSLLTSLCCRRLLEIDWIPTAIVVLSLSGLGILFSAWSYGIGTAGIGGYIPIWVFLSYLAWVLRSSQTLRYFLAGSAALPLPWLFEPRISLLPILSRGNTLLWHLSNDSSCFVAHGPRSFQDGHKSGTI